MNLYDKTEDEWNQKDLGFIEMPAIPPLVLGLSKYADYNFSFIPETS